MPIGTEEGMMKNSNEERLKLIQEHLKFSDEDIEHLRKMPHLERIVENIPEFARYTIFAEVVYSHGCTSGHQVGDRFYMDAGGNLLSKRCPKRMCIFAISPLTMAAFHVAECLYWGRDPREIAFNRYSCFDVGVRCGGWGRIVVEVSVVERE